MDLTAGDYTEISILERGSKRFAFYYLYTLPTKYMLQDRSKWFMYASEIYTRYNVTLQVVTSTECILNLSFLVIGTIHAALLCFRLEMFLREVKETKSLCIRIMSNCFNGESDFRPAFLNEVYLLYNYLHAYSLSNKILVRSEHVEWGRTSDANSESFDTYLFTYLHLLCIL